MGGWIDTHTIDIESERVKKPLKKTVGGKVGHDFTILVWLILPFSVCVCIYIYRERERE